MTTPSETRAGKLLPVMIAEMRNFADVADRCEVTNAPPAIRTWADQLEALAASEPVTRCPNCDDTGDVHRPDGDYAGRCTCPAASEPVDTEHGLPDAGTIRYLEGFQEAWIAAAETMQEVLPGFGVGPGTGIEKMQAAIRKLAATHPAPEQPGKGEAAGRLSYLRNERALDIAQERAATPQPSDPAEGDAPIDWRQTVQAAIDDIAHLHDGRARMKLELLLSTPPTAAVSVDMSDLLFVGFDNNSEHRLFRMRKTAERHCIGEIKTYAALDPQVKR